MSPLSARTPPAFGAKEGGLVTAAREHRRWVCARLAQLGRLSNPADLVAPALFLTSAANTSITGEVLREGSSTGRSSHAA